MGQTYKTVNSKPAKSIRSHPVRPIESVRLHYKVPAVLTSNADTLNVKVTN